MAISRPVITGFDQADVATIAGGQSVFIDVDRSVSVSDADSATFTGWLSAKLAGGGYYESMSLDASSSGGRITTKGNFSSPYVTQTDVSVDGVFVGTYAHIPGSNFSMSVGNASHETLALLIQHLRFTAASDFFSPTAPGVRTITVELMKSGSGNVTGTAQTSIKVVARPELDGKTHSFQNQSADLGPAQNTGVLVSQLLSDSGFKDVDGHMPAGTVIGVDASTLTQGTWQYSTNAGVQWHDVGTVSYSQGLVLSADTLLRFVPAPGFSGQVGNMNLYAVDGSDASLTFTEDATRSYANISQGTTLSYAIGLKQTTWNLTIEPSQVKHPPTLEAEGQVSTFIEDQPATALFTNVVASTEDAGQSFVGVTLTIAGVTDGGKETLNAGGTGIALTAGSQGTLADGGTFAVTMLGDTASVRIEGLALGDAAMSDWIEALTYHNASDVPTESARVITVTEIRDSGVSDNAFAPTALQATVTVQAANDAPTFAPGSGGLVTASFDNYSDIGWSVATQSDGKIVVTGYHGDNNNGSFFGVMRFNPDGSLDSSFGTGGKVILNPLASAAQSYKVIVQDDGTILVAGTDYLADAMQVVRLKADGSVDTAFGMGGTAQITHPTYDIAGQNMLVQSDGKILIGGDLTYNQFNHTFAIGRLNADGSVDTTFGNNGLFVLEYYSGMSQPSGMALDASGNILLTGARDAGNSGLAVLRVTPQGQRDDTFQDPVTLSPGVVQIDVMPGKYEVATDVLVQADGKMIVTGYGGGWPTESIIAIRLNADGSLDSSFGNQGKTIVPVGNSVNAHKLTQQVDGKLLLVGTTQNPNSDIAVVRLNADGTLDTDFGTDGVATFDSGGLDHGRDITVLPDGKLIAVGYGGPGFYNKFLVVRLNADGSIDTDFNVQPGVNTLDGQPHFTEGQAAVILDSNVRVYDAELAAQGHYDGATLTLARKAGANADDVFGASGKLSFAAGSVSLADVVIGTYTQTGGQLVVTFNAQATQSRVNDALSAITYSNASTTPPSSAVIEWTFNDGAIGDAQGSGGAQHVTGSTTVSITGVNAEPTLTQIEPIADQTEDTLVTLDFTTLLGLSNAADSDGSISGFVVKSVPFGTLKIGASAESAQMWWPGWNDRINDTSKAFWQPPANQSGLLQALTVTAVDNEGRQSGTPVAVRVDLESVPDRPTLATGADLTAIEEDVPSADVEDPSSNPPNWGDAIEDLIEQSGFADADGDLYRGIAISGNAADPATEGRWQYSNDADTQFWHDVGPVSAQAALLLASSGANMFPTYLRFVPVADFYGKPAPLIVHVVDGSIGTTVFTTWDGTTESRHTIDIDASTAVAASGVEWNVTVNGSPDAPVISHLGEDDDRIVPLPTDWTPLDIGTPVTVTDADNVLVTAGSLRIAFTGSAHLGDQLNIDATDGRVGLEDMDLVVDGVIVGTLSDTSSPGALVFDLTHATMAQIALVLQRVHFTLDSQHAGERVIEVTLHDGELETKTEVTLDGQYLPSVTISLSSPTFKAGEALGVTFTLSEAVADFAAEDVTVAGGTLSNFMVDAQDPLRYSAAITPTVGENAVSLSVSVAADSFTNALGLKNLAATPATASGDTLLPTVTSITPVGAAVTDDDVLTFRVVFSENVDGVSSAHFVVTGATGVAIQNVQAVSGTTYDVIVSGGNLASFNGDVGLELDPGILLTDMRGNAMVVFDAGSSTAFTVDNTAPVLVSVDREDVIQPAGDTAIEIKVTFADTGSGIDPATLGTSNITITRADMLSLTVTGFSYRADLGEATYTVAAPLGGWDMSMHAGSYTVNIVGGQVRDLAGLALSGQPSAHSFDIIANASPAITSNGGGATAAINHAENVLTVTTVSATDADADPLTYSIADGDDADLFTIDPTSGELRFKTALWSSSPADADGDGVYEVVVRASDDKGGFTTQTLSVSVLSDIDGDGVPDIDDTDADGDGLSDELEAGVPDLLGNGQGDGNGDGVDDNAQLHVASLPTLGAGAGTPNPWATIAVDDGLRLVDVSNAAAPSGLPRNVKMPAGQFGFSIEGLEIGGSTQVSFYIDASLRVNNYYKQNHVTQAWTSMAAATVIPGSDKVKFTFTLTDGGIFDADGVANGVIVDPGGAVIVGPRITSHGGDVTASIRLNENLSTVGTVRAEMPPGQTTLSYAISGGADAARFTIDAATGVLRFVDAPDFERPADEGADNVYDVQVTVSDQNEQSDTQALAIQVQDVDESVPVPVDSDDDGLPDDMENGVPGMEGGVQGDGNGDGIPDVEQSDVTSLTWQSPAGGQTRYVTLTNDAGLVQTRVSTTTIDPAKVPGGLTLPLGALAFTVTDVPDSGVVGFSIYVDGDVPVNGYWKEIDGQWFNLATAITEVGGKTRIDFSIEDGGRFDADGVRNGVIVDPGAPGWFDGNPYDTDADWVPDLLEAALGLTVGVKDNDVFERDDLFVMQLYRDALGREADASGLGYWQGLLTSGQADHADIVQAVLSSAEAQDLATLNRLSLGLRDEQADAGARGEWRDALNAGETVTELADAFVASTYGNVAAVELIDRLYTDLLERAADASGKAYWLGQLDAGVSAGEVATHISHASEFDAEHGTAVYAAELYEALLGRAADADGLAYWAEALQDGMSQVELIGALMASTEYHDRFLPGTDGAVG